MVAVIERHQAQQQPGQRTALIERMISQHKHIACYEKCLRNIGTIIRNDLVLLPLTCQAQAAQRQGGGQDE